MRNKLDIQPQGRLNKRISSICHSPYTADGGRRALNKKAIENNNRDEDNNQNVNSVV